jgi:hypothetical protein
MLKIKMAMISTLTMTPIPTHPFSGRKGCKPPLLAVAYQIPLTPENQGPQQKGSPFSQILIL